MYQYNGKINKIISGDTVEAEIDLGFNQQKVGTFRLYGIKTTSDAAKLKLADYVLGKDVMVLTVKQKSVEEITLVIYLPDDASSVNDRMVASNYAKRYLE